MVYWGNMHKMPEEKQITDQKMEEKKTEKPVEEKVVETPKVEEKKIDENKPKDNEKSKTDNVEDTKKDKKEEKKSDAKPVKAEGPKKTEAIVNGRDLRISTKHSVAVCDFIRNKDVDKAIGELEEVSKMKRAIPMKGEIPHRKGMMSGRYPINAVAAFLKLLKSVKANAMMNELELEKVKIYCMANVASRPRTRFGQSKHKRSHVQIKLIPRRK